MNFLKTIRNSIYSPGVYLTVLTKSFKSSLGYFLLLILFLTIIHIIFLIKPLLLEAPVQLKGFLQEMVDCYPKDLEVKIISGQVSINADEPYFIDCQDLVVIDTQTPFSSTQFDDYQVIAWVTKDSVFYKRNRYETRSYSLSQIRDFKLTSQVINSYYQMIAPYLKFVGPILLLLTFVGLYLSFNFRLIQLLLLSSIIWLMAKLFKQALTYGQSYKVGLHAITLGLIVELFISLTQGWTHFSGFPLMVSVLTLGVVSINLILPKKGQNS